MNRYGFLGVISVLLLEISFASGQSPDGGDTVARIRAEGLQRSHALALYRTITDEIGARLTGSPAHMKAARWAVERFGEWGLANPHQEPYEFGRGWQVDRVSVEMIEPRYLALIAYPDAWSPATAGVVTGPVVYVGDKTAAQVQAMAAQLRGAIVLTHGESDAGSATFPNLLACADKVGTVYLINRDNLGGYDTTSNHVVTQFTNYIIPTTADTPNIQVEFIEFPHSNPGPYYAKGIGEMPIDGPAPAIASAVAQAIGGRFINELPLLPETIMREMEPL